MRILICGSRTDYDGQKAREYLGEFISQHKDDTFIHGGANGIDLLADIMLKERFPDYSRRVKIIRPQYNVYGDKAPLIRDREMVSECDVVVAFWNFNSHGTKFTMDYAREQGKKIEIFDIREFIGPSHRLGV